jgi:flavodoxin
MPVEVSMKILVVYDSKYGNTERIARSIATGLGPAHLVRVEAVSSTKEVDPTVDLMIVGGPTQAHGASPVMRRFLDHLPELPGTHVAAFDTRYDKPSWLTGSASGKIVRTLKQHGGRPVAPAESFFVVHSEGPLADGEEDRAASWGATLVGRA